MYLPEFRRRLCLPEYLIATYQVNGVLDPYPKHWGAIGLLVTKSRCWIKVQYKHANARPKQVPLLTVRCPNTSFSFCLDSMNYFEVDVPSSLAEMSSVVPLQFSIFALQPCNQWLHPNLRSLSLNLVLGVLRWSLSSSWPISCLNSAGSSISWWEQSSCKAQIYFILGLNLWREQ